jgi:hypothetical protein
MFSRLSFGAFVLSMIALALLSTGYNPFGFSYDFLFYFGVVILGVLGFVFSLLSNFFDASKKRVNAVQSFIFYLGMLFIFAGIVFKFMHYPYVIHLLIIGIFISLVSIFIKVKPISDNDDLLDG